MLEEIKGLTLSVKRLSSAFSHNETDKVKILELRRVSKELGKVLDSYKTDLTSKLKKEESR